MTEQTMVEQVAALCDECGLPIAECSGIFVARGELVNWLTGEGYDRLTARQRALTLIPIPKRATENG